MDFLTSEAWPVSNWEADRTFCLNAWDHKQTPSGAPVFRSLESLGVIAPQEQPAPWNLLPGIPGKNARYQARYTCSGFLIENHNGKPLFLARLCAPGIWRGWSSDVAHSPKLFSPEHDTGHTENEHWMVCDHGLTTLLHVEVREQHLEWTLITDMASLDEARSHIGKQLATPALEQMKNDLIRRRPFLESIESTSPAHRRLYARSMEQMTSLLRHPEGVFTSYWVAEPSMQESRFDLLLLHVQAWCLLDPNIASGLFETALGVLDSRALLAARIHIDGQREGGPALPQLAQCAAHIQKHLGADHIPIDWIAKIENHLASLNHLLDPQHSGACRWPNQASSGLPFQTPGLCALVLEELDALNFLRDQKPDLSGPSSLDEQADALAHYLEHVLWQKDENAYVLKQETPDPYALLWGGLSPAHRPGIEDAFWLDIKDHHADTGPGTDFLTLLALRKGEYTQHLTSTEHALRKKLSDSDSNIDPAQSALGLLLTPSYHKGSDSRAQSPLMIFLDKHRMSTVLTVSAVFILSILLIVTYLQKKKSYTLTDRAALLGLAMRYYEEERFDDAKSIYTTMIENTGGDGEVFYRLGNLYFREKQYAAAEAQFRLACKNPVMRMRALNNLAISLREQGQFEDAYRCFSLLGDETQEIRPDLAKKARYSMQLMEKSHPELTEIEPGGFVVNAEE